MERDDNMISKFSIQRVEMRDHAVTTLHLAAGEHLINRQGTLWITRSNDSCDYWLMPGAGLSFPHASTLLLQAYGDSTLTVESRRPATFSALALLKLLQRALRTLRTLAVPRTRSAPACGQTTTCATGYGPHY